MAKSTGLGWTSAEITDAGAVARELRTGFSSLDWASPYEQSDVSGLDTFGPERLLLKQDFKGNVMGPFDPVANGTHAVFSGDLRVAREMTLEFNTVTLGPTTVLFTEYGISRASNGELTFKNPWVLSDGVPPVWS